MEDILVRNALVVLVGDVMQFDDADFAQPVRVRKTSHGLEVKFGASRVAVDIIYGKMHFLARNGKRGSAGPVSAAQIERVRAFLAKDSPPASLGEAANSPVAALTFLD